MVLETALGDPVFWLAAFAGGAFAASIGALPAFIFTGFMVIAGEAAALGGAEADVTGLIGFGPVFGPHISFAAGAAAAAYAAKQGYLDDGKDIASALGTHNVDVLIVGGLFGVFGFAVVELLNFVEFGTDNIALIVFVSALVHRVAFGYDIVGEITGDNIFDMSPAERGEENAPGIWLPWQYKPQGVAMIGLVGGLLGGFTYIATESVVLVFGISAASLVFLNCGIDDFPVTHHITLPGAVGAFGAAASGFDPTIVMLFAVVFGLFGAFMGELCNRVFYAHGKTHVDPPAFGIAASGFLATLLVAVGLFDASFYATFGL
jgi:hypothetical protein